MEDYSRINEKRDLEYSEVPINKPLTKIQSYDVQTALKMNTELIKAQHFMQESKDIDR
jgi:hypothetical protein